MTPISCITFIAKLFVVSFTLGSILSLRADSVLLQHATATYSQTAPTVQSIGAAIDGSFDQAGWGIYPQTGQAQAAVFTTTNDVGFANGTVLTFTLIQGCNAPPYSNLGRFRLSVTGDERTEFADGLETGGDVTANWTIVQPITVSSISATLTILADNSILASGYNASNEFYVVEARTDLATITGIRLEVLPDPSLPFNGPGRQPENGNFVLSEVQLTASPDVPPAKSAFQAAAATFSQADHGVGAAMDGRSADDFGWAISPQTGQSQIAVFATATDIDFPTGALLTFRLAQNFSSTAYHTLGRFRLSVTTDDRSEFADGLETGGDVAANWTILEPSSLASLNGATLSKLNDNSVLVSGVNPPTDTYIVTAATILRGITGVRLEVLPDASLPFNGPGRQPENGNFVLSEIVLGGMAQPSISSLSPKTVIADGGGLTLDIRGTGFDDLAFIYDPTANAIVNLTGSTVYFNDERLPYWFLTRLSANEVVVDGLTNSLDGVSALASWTSSSLSAAGLPDPMRPVVVRVVHFTEGQADFSSNPEVFTILTEGATGASTLIGAGLEGFCFNTPAGRAAVSASFRNTGPRDTVLSVATLPASPVPVNVTGIGGGVTVIQQVFQEVDAPVTKASFYYPSTLTGDVENDLRLYYYESLTGSWQEVRDSVGALPSKTIFNDQDGTSSGGRFQVQFDNNSSPPIYELGVGLFTVALPPSTPAGYILALEPGFVPAGSSDTTLQIRGVNFSEGSIIKFGVESLDTTYVSPGELRGTIPAALLASTEDLTTVPVTVTNLGFSSNIKNFALVAASVSRLESTTAQPGESRTIDTITSSGLAAAGLVTVTNRDDASQPVSVTLANYSNDPTSVHIDAGGGYVDLQVAGADPSDTVNAIFFYPVIVVGQAEQELTLKFFTGTAWEDVKSSGGAIPYKDTTDNFNGIPCGGLFEVFFDETSSPKITELHGTIFAMAKKDNTPPTLSCQNVTVGCSTDLEVPVSYPPPNVSDDTDIPAHIRISCSPPLASKFRVGTTSVSCTATDQAGNVGHAAFTVTRAALDFTGFLAPIGGSDSTGGTFAKPLRSFKANSTIPVKFSLGCSGSPLMTGVHRLTATKYTDQTTAGDPIDATPQGAATSGNQFQLADGHWQFNLDTKATHLTVGIWQLTASLSDGTQHLVWIQIK